MKKKKRSNKAATMAAVMGVTAAMQSVSPIVYAQEQNPEMTSNQTNIDNVTKREETSIEDNTIKNVTTNKNIDTQVKSTENENISEVFVDTAKGSTNEGIALDVQHFPDENFRKVVARVYDQDSNGYLTNQEIAKIRDLNLSNLQIVDIKGIEYFTELEHLDASYNNITSMDISKNHKLQKLYISNNPISLINVSQNKALKLLNFEKTKISKIDLSALHQLETLNFSETGITSIDLSNNKSLQTLIGTNVNLTSLDVRMLSELSFIDIRKSNRVNFIPLNGLDLSQNTKLTTAYLQNNLCSNLNVDNCFQLTNLDCSGNQLTSLDIHNLTRLTKLNCSQNQLTELDVTNQSQLTKLECNNNRLTYLDLSHQHVLTKYQGYGNQLLVIELAEEVKDVIKINDFLSVDLNHAHVKDGYDFSKINPKFDSGKVVSIEDNNCNPLKDVRFEGNVLKGLDTKTNCYIKYRLGDNAILTFIVSPEVYCDEFTFPDAGLRELIKSTYDINKDGILGSNEISNITTIDLSNHKEIKDLTGLENFVNLHNLHCDNMDIVAIDVSKNKELNVFTATGIQNLKNVNVSGCSQLTTLRLNRTGITSLDVTKNANLKTLDCTDTKLTSIDVTKNSSLNNLFVTGTDISTLNVKKNFKLKELQLSNTKVRSLDLSQNEKLEILAIINCHMDTLDISHNAKLMNLFANFNNFTELNIENNKNLKFLEVLGNKLTKLDISHLTKLERFSASGQPLQTIDVTHNSKLKELYVSNTGISNLDVRQNPALTMLECERNNLSTLDLTQNPQLNHLYCGKNHLYDIQFAKEAPVKYYIVKNQEANTIILEDAEIFDLKELYGKNVEISNVKGAVIDGMMLKDIKRGTDITYTITYDNGITLDVTLKFVVNNAWKTPLTVSDWTYGETPILPYAEARFGDVTYTYSDCETGTFTRNVPMNAGTWYVKASVESEGYLEMSSIASFTIHKATPNITIPKVNAFYGQTTDDIVLPEGFTWKHYTNFEHTGDYTVKAVYTPKDTNNYNPVDVDVVVHIDKAKNTWITPLDIEDWYQGQTPKEPYAKAAFGKVQYVYSNQKYGIYTNTQPTQKGIWYVKAIVDDCDDYHGLVSEPQAFEIKVKQITTIIHGSIPFHTPVKDQMKPVSKKTTSVQTGDHTKAGLFTMMGVISLAALTVLSKRKKR